MLRTTLLAAALSAAFPAFAQSELDTLRAELNDLKTSYEARIAALEARIREAAAQPAVPADMVRAADGFNP